MTMRALLLMLLLAALPAHAQVQIDACEAPNGCAFVTDPYPAGPVQPVTCALIGVGATPIVAPAVDGPSLVPPQPAGKTCYWPKVVLAPGAYSLTAISTDQYGRPSVAPSPPFALTVLGPRLGAPAGLRNLSQ
jgi:hypothetical protein